MKFGDPVTNVCARETSPTKRAYFVRHVKRGGTQCIECTDKKGKFWETVAEAVFPGHLTEEHASALCRQIWERRFGKRKQDAEKS